MGTSWSVVIHGEAPAGFRNKVVQAIDSVEQAMSTWIEGTEISQFNQMEEGESINLTADSVTVIQCAMEVWRKSGGVFDVTVGSPEGDSSGLKLDPESGTLTKLQPNLEIDLSAIAKGFGVDKVAELLIDLGCENFLVEIGGELRGRGVAEDGDPWTIAIERPGKGQRKLAGKIDLVDAAVATSGNYRRRDHILDPQSRRSVNEEMMSVTVVHASAMEADAWATAMFVLGEEKGLTLAKKLGLNVAFTINPGDDQELKVVSTDEFPWQEKKQ